MSGEVTIAFRSVSVSIGAFLFWLLLVFTYIDKKRNGQTENKYFKYLLVMDLLLIISRTASILLKQYMPNNLQLIDLMTDLYYLAIAYSTVLFMFILIDFLAEKGTINEKRLKIISIILLLIPIITILFLDTTIELLNGVYTFGGSYIVITYIYSALLFVVVVYFSIKNKKNLIGNRLLPIILMAILYIGDLVFHYAFGLIFLDISSIYTMITILLYLTFESQDNRLLNEYIESKLEAEKVNNAKIEFLIDMSHQIRTPLSTILGFGEVLNKEESNTKKELEEEIEIIKDSANELTYLIDNLLDVSKLEKNDIELEEQEYSLDNMLYEIQSVIRPRITENKNIKIDLNNNIPSKYYGDNKMVFKVITYLLLNSFNNTQFGNVSLWVDGIKKENNFEFEIIISNKASQIEKELFDLTLDDYMNDRKNKKIKSDVIIAKRIAEILGGNVELSLEEKQYIFTFTQRIIDETPIGNVFGEEALNRRKEISDYTNKKALMVGNVNSNVRLFVSTLKNKNMDISFEQSGKKVKENLISNKYDIIFINYDLLDIGLKNVLDNLKSAGMVLPPIAVLASYPSGVEKIEDSGVNMYLKVPMDSTTLYNSINTLLNGGDK